jgi:hypothetical protein
VKHVLIAATIATAVVAWGVPAAASASSPCAAKETKINGQTAIVNCGPATATLRYKGKTYKFKSGTCLSTAGTITLDLGTNFLGDNNHGYAHFSLTMLSVTTAPVLATSGKLTINGSAKLSSRGATGTFKGLNTVIHGTSITTAPLSGSWHCGQVYKF